MKKKFTLIFCLFAIIVQSQELKTIELFSPESKEITDLSFLKEELQEKKLVMIGEQTHMYGNIFEMKARIVEYLHQELGFTTIAMESSMYDIWKMNKKGFNPKNFNNVIWGVWSNTSEFQRLVNYIAENNIKVIGFDSQVKNSSQFIDDFYNYLEGKNITIKFDEDDFGIIIEGVLENYTVEEYDIEYKTYEKELKRIIGQIEKLEQNETNYYWKQFTKSLLASSQDAHYNQKEILTTDFGNKNDNIRDEQMADNLLSYIFRNPNEKIICWADNIHILNDNSSIKKPIAKDFISMGSYIHKELKGKSYSLATIHANDSLLDSGTRIWHKTPIEKNSFEDELSNFKTAYLFVTSNQEGMKLLKSTRLLNFIDFTEARLDQLHDGYIFFQNATLPKLETKTDTIKTSNKKIVLSKKINQIELGQNVILKGQILNSENSEPIPFATLILKKEEIYRVADDNGYFELPVKKTMLQTASVSISSIGFETKTVLLNDLNEKIFLKPKFEELDEVVITGYLSPKTVLQKAISKKSLNHPVEPFNFYRYIKLFNNINDSNELDLEFISKDYDLGYLSPYRITNRVEQVKWNINKTNKKDWNTYQLLSTRQNSIRYSNILHKRKYKKFKLNFIKSNSIENEGLYIIAFETERNKWNYTNRGYPTKYSGRVYIDKENFAIVKVIENWESRLNQLEVEKYLTKRISGKYENIKNIIIKEEHICTYAQINNNGRYYAAKFFNRQYSESLDKNNKKYVGVSERDSYFFDFKLNEVENIEYEYRVNEQSLLNRVEYNESFWNSFYKREISEKPE